MSPITAKRAFLLLLVLASPAGAAARRREVGRIPMPTAKATCVEHACRRVYGDAPPTVQFCTQTYLPVFYATTTRTLFCPSNAARIDRIPACVDALASNMFVEVVRDTVPNYPAAATLDACSEAQLCGAPFF